MLHHPRIAPGCARERIQADRVHVTEDLTQTLVLHRLVLLAYRDEDEIDPIRERAAEIKDPNRAAVRKRKG